MHKHASCSSTEKDISGGADAYLLEKTSLCGYLQQQTAGFGRGAAGWRARGWISIGGSRNGEHGWRAHGRAGARGAAGEKREGDGRQSWGLEDGDQGRGWIHEREDGGWISGRARRTAARSRAERGDGCCIMGGARGWRLDLGESARTAATAAGPWWRANSAATATGPWVEREDEGMGIRCKGGGWQPGTGRLQTWFDLGDKKFLSRA